MKKLLAIIAFFIAAAFWLLGQEAEETIDIREYKMTEAQYLALPSVLWQSAEQPFSLVSTNSKGHAYGGWCLRRRDKDTGLLVVEIHGGPDGLKALAGEPLPKPISDAIKTSLTASNNFKVWAGVLPGKIISTNSVKAVQEQTK